MTISIWRYSHFILAFASSLFLLIASVTGVILAIEPISHQAKGYAVQDLDKISLGTTTEALKKNYDDVFALEVETSGFVKASVLTLEMEMLDIYIDPNTGLELGQIQERPFIYSFATNLHRSLFLKSIGRFFVGLISLLLLLITITGVLLLAKRQGGFKRLFSKVQKDYFELRYHVILSRWFFIPIVILAFTGVYLSAEKFELLPNATITHKEINNTDTTERFEHIIDIPFFKATTLDQIRKVDFPFSENPEEYYQVALKNKEIRVSQQTGQIVSEANYPFVALASRLSWKLHTGEGNVFWSIVLLLASASILFFMYSGFAMTLKRRKKVKAISIMPDKDDCEFVILVGSETGTTFDFARQLYTSLNATGKKVYMTELNKYCTFAKARRIIIFTATYGEGEPPSNARKFEAIFSTIQQPNKIRYSVVGFGSLEYPDYCKFAIKVDAILQIHPDFQPLFPLYKINNADAADFENWVKQLSKQIDISLSIQQPKKIKRQLKQIPFEVLGRTGLNVDDTFLIRLKPKKKIKFTSGDLLVILIKGTTITRQYSIARIGDEILLSIKKHEFGQCSSYLYELSKGDTIEAAVKANQHFHFPKKTTATVLIANGTGIAPYLGMIEQNRNTTINLFWGGRTVASSAIYDDILKGIISKNENNTIHKSHSREGSKEYVQNLVIQQKDSVLKTVQEGGVVMICGSLAMQHDVLDVLESLLAEHSATSLDELQHNGQLKMDCY
ncbi:NADPH-dependent sulfite reductase flavoprotein cytochrome subunit CysJ-like protein [Psychroflexus torquis ATCC 700755]|uniref:NADPH--hemoprotein reductase n=1 Tax=Psychroflexus torquis (strain ATCC 700755 / CIP 106069 / ACAM 623) TaxID=313595 RepID=K4IHZ0_PSYTT|nr:PepSY domain-containing protein [Psychroflexus torquis]AFU68686.1 NADPH-dependent sulfite reductase flavoprotein cytochrome subunit CysJ-like protein [Psychroflexus torquis ATCC 700755]